LNNYPATTLSLQNVIDVNTPAAVVFASTAVDTGTDTITAAAHGLFTGLKGQFTTTGALPTGLALVTDYFIIAVTSGTFKVATTYNNAIAGIAIDLTAQGSGNDTFTATAIAGATIAYYISNDAVTWDIYGAATSITADSTSWFFATQPSFNYLRWTITLTAGSVSTSNNVAIYGGG
jgi:hypothetical protein